MKYRISTKAEAQEKLRLLFEKAIHFTDALKRINNHRLQTRPLEWGDPEYRLIHEGASFVRYAIYEIEEVVYVLDAKWATITPDTGE